MWLRIGNRIYTGELVYRGKKEDVEIDVYCTNPVHERFLVLRKTQGESQDIVVTGLHRIHEVIGKMEDSKQKEVLEAEIAKGLQQIKQQSLVKSLKRPDFTKLKALASRFCENNWATLMVLGINHSDFLSRAEKEAAS